MPKKVYEKPTLTELDPAFVEWKRYEAKRAQEPVPASAFLVSTPLVVLLGTMILDDRTNPDELDEPIPFALGNGTVLP